MYDAAARRAHEPSHVRLPAVAAGIGVMAAGIIISLAAATFVASRVPSPRSAPNNAVRPKVEGPMQLTDPRGEREALQAEKSRRLQSAGVDEKSGARHIPIDEAMRVMAEDGRP